MQLAAIEISIVLLFCHISHDTCVTASDRDLPETPLDRLQTPFNSEVRGGSCGDGCGSGCIDGRDGKLLRI